MVSSHFGASKKDILCLRRPRSKHSALSCIKGFPMNFPSCNEIKYLEISFVRTAPDFLNISALRHWIGWNLNETWNKLSHFHTHAQTCCYTRNTSLKIFKEEELPKFGSNFSGDRNVQWAWWPVDFPKTFWQWIFKNDLKISNAFPLTVLSTLKHLGSWGFCAGNTHLLGNRTAYK